METLLLVRPVVGLPIASAGIPSISHIGFVWWCTENNKFTNIPTEIGALTSVTELSISENQLTGFIPSEIGLMFSLTSLDLSKFVSCDAFTPFLFVGDLPSSLAHLARTHFQVTTSYKDRFQWKFQIWRASEASDYVSHPVNIHKIAIFCVLTPSDCFTKTETC